MRRLSLATALLLCTAAAQAQPTPVPRDAEAESTFEQAVEAYRAGDFGMAFRRFRLVVRDHPLNEKTTAALAMAAKARFREGAPSDAADLARDLVRNYPRSRYVPEMQALLARVQGQGPAVRPVVDVGVALPLVAETAGLTQAFFNGLRLAADEANAEGQAGPRMRLVFQNTHNTATGAAAAVAALRSTAVVVGPLFSDEAIAAGDAAAQSGTVLVAPLATDERVSAGHPTVFQANVPLNARGPVLAQYATGTMGLRRFGVVYEGEVGGTSERLARGFADAVQRSGGTVAFVTALTSGWSGLVTRIGADALAGVDALYLPVSGNNAEVDVRAALSALDRAGAHVTVLGDAEWHNRAAARALGPAFRVTYTNDFSFDPADADVQRFAGAYRAAFGDDVLGASFTTQRLAATGYSLGRFLASRVASQNLARVLTAAGTYEGVGVRFNFAGGGVNRALYVQQYTNDGIRRLQ